MTETTNPMEEEAMAAERSDADLEGDPGDALQAEMEQVRAQYQRAVADYQNLERRSREERQELGRFVVADVVRSFLPVLDDLDRAIEAVAGETEEPAWVEGVRLVAQKFRGVLQHHGVEEIPSVGQPFDPNQHEAVGSAAGPEGQVVHLLQRGYVLNERVIRPAMVMVGDGEGASTSPPDDDEGATTA